MSSLADIFLSLNPDQRRFVHFELCRNALEIWEKYVAKFDEISYIEWVVGTQQVVDKSLLNDAFESAEIGKDLLKVDARFGEPIVALQDEDLEFPDNIKFAFYAIYNLFKKYVLNADIDDWLIANQSLSTETDSGNWESLLGDAILKSL